MIGKGTVRSAKVSLHTLTIVKLSGVVGSLQKVAKPSKLLLEGCGRKGRGTRMIGKGAVRSERVSFHTLTK